jgi:hypothetical protein
MSHSWLLEKISGQIKRAVGMAMQIMIGDLGSISGVLQVLLPFCLLRTSLPPVAHRLHRPSHPFYCGSQCHVLADGEQRIIGAREDEDVDRETKVSCASILMRNGYVF